MSVYDQKFVMLYAGAMERTQIEQTIVFTDFSRGIGCLKYRVS